MAGFCKILKREIADWSQEDFWLREYFFDISFYKRFLGFHFYNWKYDGEPRISIFLGFIRIMFGWNGYWEFNSTGMFLEDLEDRKIG